jgi:hypothetical protein
LAKRLMTIARCSIGGYSMAGDADAAGPMFPIEIKGDAQASFDPPNDEAAPPIRPAFDDEIEYEWQRYVALDDQTGPAGRHVQDETLDAGIPK